jgi:hypothetical protein
MKRVYKLAFMGKMGAGKSTVALEALGLFVAKHTTEDSIGYFIKFANPLHQCALAFHRREKPRTFLQRLGDLGRREFGDDVFERIFEENVEGLITKKVPELEQNNILLMTDDLRFTGEYNLVKRLGFTVIAVGADEELRKQRIGPAFTNVKHRSEMEMEQITPDFVIDNNEDDPHMLAVNSQLRQIFNEHKLIGD